MMLKEEPEGALHAAINNPTNDLKKDSSKRGLLKTLGPGLVTGASDDDPSGIATYSQDGAQFALPHALDHVVFLSAYGVHSDYQRADSAAVRREH